MGAVLAAVAIAARIFFFNSGEGYVNDINCFKSWAVMLFENGFSGFYLSDAFTDYPPGYMYALWAVGFIRDALGLEHGSAAFTALIKLPAVLCDAAGVAVLYDMAKKRLPGRMAVLAALAYALNPAVIINSAVWGQVDAVYTLLILVSLRFMTSEGEHRLMFSYLFYAAALLVKPQALMFAPVYAFSAFDCLSRGKFSRATVAALAQDCLIALGVIALAIIPFTRGLDFSPVIEQYRNTVFSYPYASVNAYNFFGLFGANWAPVSGRLLFMSYNAWGFLFIVCASLASLYILYRRNEPGMYFFAAAFLNTMTFVFSTQMHERYIFPSLALLMAAFVHTKSKPVLLLMAGFSVTLYVNCADVLADLSSGGGFSAVGANITPVSLVNVGMAAFMIYWAVSGAAKAGKAESPAPKPLSASGLRLPKHWDIAAVALITLAYSVLAFMNLGDMSAPEDAWRASDGEAVADLGSETPITGVIYMNGATDERFFALSFSSDGVEWGEEVPLGSGSVFAWREEKLEQSARYVKILPRSDDLMLMEMGFKNEDGLLPTAAATGNAEGLFGERDMIPPAPGYLNSTYFDEIYHARTAYEYSRGLTPYETTHPPLGKGIIALGVGLFGMNPFGFRVMGTVFGILMLPLIYAFARRVCGADARFWHVFAVAALAADFMHFTQTRMATVDSFLTFFILAAYYFMYCYQAESWGGGRKVYAPLALSGLCMGLAVAVKWQGVYAGLGLAVLFFADLWRRRSQEPGGFFRRAAPVLGACVVFFVAVPLAVYALSYIPYLRAPGMDGLKSIADNQISMFEYHSQLTDSHPFESPWWQWPLDVRPVFLHVTQLAGGLCSAISVMGNPAVWYAGLAAVIYAVFNKTGRAGAFLLVAFAAQILPWIPVERCTFIYHYFPCVGFMILLLALSLQRGNRRGIGVAVCAAAFVMFAVYYPVISGQPVDGDFVREYLQWIPSWVIVG